MGRVARKLRAVADLYLYMEWTAWMGKAKDLFPIVRAKKVWSEYGQTLSTVLPKGGFKDLYRGVGRRAEPALGGGEKDV